MKTIAAGIDLFEVGPWPLVAILTVDERLYEREPRGVREREENREIRRSVGPWPLVAIVFRPPLFLVQQKRRKREGFVVREGV